MLRTTLSTITLVLSLYVPSFSQTAYPVSTTPSPLQAPLIKWGGTGYLDLPHLRQDKIGGLLGDIDSQLQQGHIYSHPDRMIWAHETTHGINSRLRLGLHSPNGYYLLGGLSFSISSPPGLTLSQVAQAVPQNRRGRIYKLYMLDPQHDVPNLGKGSNWNDTPLYVMDEMVAYTNDILVGLELYPNSKITEMNGGAYQCVDSYENARELWRYGLVAQELARRGTPWQDQSQFDMFMEICRMRLAYIYKTMMGKGWVPVRSVAENTGIALPYVWVIKQR